MVWLCKKRVKLLFTYWIIRISKVAGGVVYLQTDAAGRRLPRDADQRRRGLGDRGGKRRNHHAASRATAKSRSR